jgi:acetyl esterase
MRPELTAVSARDEQLDGPAGPIAVRIFTPTATTTPTPLIVFFHGGGWVVGDLDTHTQQGRRLAVEVGAVVVSVDYRLAPEAKFPAAFDDCVAAAEWAHANAARLGADPDLLVTAGDSAGGQLAASVAIARRDAGQPLAGQLLLYPVTSLVGGYIDEAANAVFPSRAAQALGPGLTLAGMAFFSTAYAEPDQYSDWRVSPRSADLRGVAPAVVHTAQLDLLRDEGNAYAAALEAAGVKVITRVYPALNHGYFGLGSVSDAADAAASQAAADVRTVLGLADRA